MIQLLGLREVKKNKKSEVFFEKGWRLTDVREVFNDRTLHNVLSTIPEDERYNLYYTVADCYEETGRKLKEQWAIPFDIDSLKLVDEGGNLFVKDACKDVAIAAVKAAAVAIDVAYDDLAIVFSGNGVQFFILLDSPIVDDSYFDKTRVAYKQLADKIAVELKKNNIEGTVDTSVWSRGRLMRLPNTYNRKKDKPERLAFTIQEGRQIKFALSDTVVSGIEASESIIPESLKNYPKPDTMAVCSGCKFLQWCNSNQAEVKEPQWFAMSTILVRLDDGDSLMHSYSSGHPDYNSYETELKIEHAKNNTGPRTCRNISTLWDGCQSCDNYGKVVSPIMIKGEDYISSADYGYRERKQLQTDDGSIRIVPGKVLYSDLVKAFNLLHPFKVVKDNDQVIVYNGKHWEYITDRELMGWATEMVKPEPSQSEMSEFIARLKARHITSLDELHEHKHGFLNFSNCVLNFDTGETFPHSPDYGFFDVRPFAYDPYATAPVWDKFLLDVMEGNESLAATLNEFGGYCISGDRYWLHKALVLIGDGGNGKSVYMETLGKVVGRNSHSAIPMQDLVKDTMRYRLVNKLFNYSEETSTDALFRSEVFKTISVGGVMSVKQLYVQEYEVPNNAKLILSMNSVPISSDRSDGLFRRLAIVKFNAKFKPGDGKHDPDIKEKLEAELPGICNRLIEGYRRLKKAKMLSASTIIEQEVQKFREDSDPVVLFSSEVVTIKDGAFIKSSELYDSYKMFCESSGYRPLNIVNFGKAFCKIHNIDSDVKKINNKTVRGYGNVTIEKDY